MRDCSSVRGIPELNMGPFKKIVKIAVNILYIELAESVEAQSADSNLVGLNGTECMI